MFDTLPDLKTPSCHKCRQPCSDKDKFCTSCGSPLFEPCLNCGEPLRLGKPFCGVCGTRKTDIIAKQDQHVEDTFQRVQNLSSQGNYEEAIDLLKPLKNVEDAAVHNRVVQTIQALARDYRKGAARAEEVLLRAEAYIENHHHKQAHLLIETLPAGLRTDAIEQLYKSTSTTLAEISELESSLERVNNGHLSPSAIHDLQHLLMLVPNHGRARAEASRLAKRLVAAANKQVDQGKYREALRLLKLVPDTVISEEIAALQSRVAEIVWLMDDLAKAPLVDRVLPSVAARLASLAPGDRRVAQVVSKVKQRVEKFSHTDSLDMPAWQPHPQDTAIGCPVEWLTGMKRLAINDKAIFAKMKAYPGCFAVAAGLALQGLDKGPITLNLLAKDSGKLLRRLTGFSRAREVNAAWGIDLSPSGLKAVRLELDAKQDGVVVDRCELFEHSKPLSLTADAAEQLQCIRETLSRFLQSNKIESERVCAGLLSRHVLYRNVKIPPLRPSQIAGAMALEARQQFPVDLDQLNWRYQHINCEQADKSVQGSTILLIAAKSASVRQRLDLLKEIGIKPDILQSDSLALHNFYNFENASFQASTMPDETASNNTSAVAIVDVGSNATNLLVSSADSVWINTTSIGGDRFTKALVKRLGLTNDQAEQIKRNPAKAKMINEVYEALDPLFNEMAADIERSLSLFANAHPNNQVVRILGVGGSFQTHGLLARLRAARSTSDSS